MMTIIIIIVIIIIIIIVIMIVRIKASASERPARRPAAVLAGGARWPSERRNGGRSGKACYSIS